MIVIRLLVNLAKTGAGDGVDTKARKVPERRLPDECGMPEVFGSDGCLLTNAYQRI